MERTVVELRHIDCKKWERICKEVHMSRSRVNVHYNAALDIILSNARAQKLVQEFEQRQAPEICTEKNRPSWKRQDTTGHSPVVFWYRGKRQGQEQSPSQIEERPPGRENLAAFLFPHHGPGSRTAGAFLLSPCPAALYTSAAGRPQTPFALGRSCRGAAQGLPCEFATPSPVRVLSEK